MNFDVDAIREFVLSPDVMTGAAIMLLVLVVVSVLMRGRRSRNQTGAATGSFRHQQVAGKSFGSAGTETESFKRTRGVSFLQPRKGDDLYIDAISESLMSDQAMTSPEGGFSDEECRVDAITEAEVYLTYNRPEQAIQVLEEAYDRGDTMSAGRIAVKLLDVYLMLKASAGTEEQLLKFIDRLFADRARFTDEEWAQLAEKIMEVREDVLPPDEVRDSADPNNNEDGSISVEYDDKGNLVYRDG